MSRESGSRRPWVAIQRNPSSGSGPQKEYLLQLVKALRQHGIRPLVFENRDRMSKAIANPLWREKLVCIVAAGGDGTVGDVLNRYSTVRVAILPLGTENLLARYLEIPKSGQAVAQMIADAHVRRLDLATVGRRRFVLMASIGFDADVVHRTHAARRGHIWRGTYVQPILRSLRSYQYPRLRLWLDDSDSPLEAKLAVIVNLNAYAFGIKPAGSACGDDGLLDLRLFERGSAFQMLRYFYKVFRGTHERLGDVRSFRAARIRVESDAPAPIQVDGDPAGWTPAEIRVLPLACEIIVPKAHESWS